MLLNHLSLTVADLDRSATFYADHFGFNRRLHDDADFVMLQSSEGSIIALEPGAATPGVGTTVHFGFNLPTVAEVRAAHERLVGEGLDVIVEQDDGRMLIIRVIDPDGYTVELFAW